MLTKSSDSLFLVFFVTLLVVAVLASALYARRERRKAAEDPDTAESKTGSGVNEDFFNEPTIDPPNWTDFASGTVGRDEVLNENGAQLTRNKIDRQNNAGKRCVIDGVEMPPSWLHTDEDRTCALDIHHHVVRNNCSMENSTLFGEDTVLDDAYIDPNTHRCNTHFSGAVSSSQIREFRQEVDVEFLLSILQELRDEVSRLENRREELANKKHDLQEQIRENEEKLDRLEERIDELETEISSVEDKIADLETEIDKLQDKVSELRRKANKALIGSDVKIEAPDGRKWKIDVDGRIRLNRGREMCMKVIGDDSRIYKSHEGMLAFFLGDDSENTVRHRGHTMWAEPLNRGPNYDFAYRIRYYSDGAVMENDYGGTSYVGYDSNRDEVRIYTDSNRAMKWKFNTGCEYADTRVGPPDPHTIRTGGYCCSNSNGMRFTAFQKFRFGRTTIIPNGSGTITVRLGQDLNRSSKTILETRTFSVSRGRQVIDLDITVPGPGQYILFHDRNA